MDPFVIGFISYAFVLAATAGLIVFSHRTESRRPHDGADWEAELAALPLI